MLREEEPVACEGVEVRRSARLIAEHPALVCGKRLELDQNDVGIPRGHRVKWWRAPELESLCVGMVDAKVIGDERIEQAKPLLVICRRLLPHGLEKVLSGVQ